MMAFGSHIGYRRGYRTRSLQGWVWISEYWVLVVTGDRDIGYLACRLRGLNVRHFGVWMLGTWKPETKPKPKLKPNSNPNPNLTPNHNHNLNHNLVDKAWPAHSQPSSTLGQYASALLRDAPPNVPQRHPTLSRSEVLVSIPGMD